MSLSLLGPYLGHGGDAEVSTYYETTLSPVRHLLHIVLVVVLSLFIFISNTTALDKLFRTRVGDFSKR